MRTKILLLLLFLQVSIIFASGGDGISFRLPNSLLQITWSEQQEINSLPELEVLSLLQKISNNYDKIDKINKNIWIDYLFIEDQFKVKISQKQDNSWQLTLEKNFSNENELFDYLLNQISIIFGLEQTSLSSSSVYIVFIPSSYLDKGSTYESSVYSFLQKSEIYLVNNSAIQSNIQGYVYSIFISKNKMYEYLNDLNISRFIVNRRKIDSKSFQTWNTMLN